MLPIKETKVRNFLMRYVDTGDETPEGPSKGLPLVLIHGYPLSLEMWAPQILGLSDFVRVIAPSLRGHGGSQGVAGPNSMDLLAEDINALLDSLNITQPVALCGLSMGGYVAMAFLRKHGPRVSRLILAATRGGAETEQGRAGRDQAAAAAREKGMQAVVDGMLPKMLAPKTLEQRPEVVEQARKVMLTVPLDTAVADLMGMKDRPDSFPTMGQTHIPALVIHGADDQLMPVKEAEKLHDALPTSRLEVIPEAGHLLNLEHPEVFNQLVRHFLGSIPDQTV